LVDDLMEVSRITRGKIDLQKTNFNLKDAVDQAVAVCLPAIRARNHVFQLSLDAANLTVSGDETRLVQVFSNLLNNAAKFTPPGGEIELSMAREADESIVCVRDNGRGISRPMLGRIFELFAQERIEGESCQGIGVGLSLARSLVELHGGRIEASSDGPGRGSVFTVRLPISRGEEFESSNTTATALQPETIPKGVILIVDDNREAADSLKALLEAVGQEAHATYCAEDALKEIEAIKPDIVFLDLLMPTVDGYETARRIRKLPGGKAIRLVALSGLGRAEDRNLSFEAGIDQHLVKPISMQALRGCLTSLLDGDAGPLG
jgi:CheY-like chemotaxis protein